MPPRSVRQIARSIGVLTEVAGQLTLGVGALVGAGFEAALLAWVRHSELTADRAALLVMQDGRCCASMLMKLAAGCPALANGLNVDAFISQARAYCAEQPASNADKLYRILARSGLPFTS